MFNSPEGLCLHKTNWRRPDGRSSPESPRARPASHCRYSLARRWSRCQDGSDVAGHQSMQLTVDLYVHWQSPDSDAAALARVTAPLMCAPGALATKV